MFLVVIGILSLILTFPAPPFPWLAARLPVFASVAVATLLPALVMHLGAGRAVRSFETHPEDPTWGQNTQSNWALAAQITLAICHGSLIACTRWLTVCERLPIVGDVPGLPGLVAAMPFLFSILLVWVVGYPAERAARQIALEIKLFEGKPAHPAWELGEYVLFQFRHQVLFILVPMLLVLIARDLIDWRKEELIARFNNDDIPDLLLGVAAVGVAVFTPAILRHVWDTRPLPQGTLRSQLDRMCQRLGMRCREILVWRTGGMIVNAMVMGVLPRWRYVLITDGLLERMEDVKIEAVFGHESGHVKRRHIWYFMLFAFISGCLMTVVAQYVRSDRGLLETLVIVAGVVMLFKWGVVFGWVSRQFERQADLFGVRTLALSGLECSSRCALHAGVAGGPAPFASLDGRRLGGEPLCPTAAHVFADMLHEVAKLNGIPPEAPSWRHGSISLRARTVEALAHDPAAAARFERRVWRIQMGILIAAALAIAWAAWSIRIWTIFGIGVDARTLAGS
jgi:STE24 endopeptidase